MLHHHVTDEFLDFESCLWFNNGKYDFSYQWITRVARDPQTQRIFGEGIRLGMFQLDKTGRTVEKWLSSNPFYGPY